MAENRGDQLSDNDNGSSPTTGQQGHESEFGQQQQQQQQRPSASSSPNARSRPDDGMIGQPIGGNDSKSGSGTTLTQGADFGDQTATGQTQTRSGSDTNSGDQDSGTGDSTSSSAQARGFVGSQGIGTADSSDFAKQGRGALDDEQEDRSAKDPSDALSERSDSDRI